ncbi:MAG TPA: SDR family oxidoreductase [Phycisphaerae bacterium]|nr:SDR family oxidoreductase [Phycisphaerae bacterium]
MLGPQTTILITGVTGLIGGELVRRLVRCGVGKIFCLIRPTPEATATERLVQRLRRSGDLDLLEGTASLQAVAGDVTLPRFGLSVGDAALVADSVNMVIHCASELSFIRDVSCRQTNVVGMQNLIELVRDYRRSPLIVHVSTATICGSVSHQCVTEEDSDDPDVDHFNEYTRSKAAAERVLRESGLPALVLRPSIVLSAELPSEDFAKAILWFLPLLNEFDAVPVDPASRVDVVPVSFVADSMIRLLQAPTRAYDCYHVSAGPAGALRCGDVGRYLDEFYQRANPILPVPPDQWTRQIHRRYVATRTQRKLFATLKHYLPFLNMDVVYDNTRLRNELGGGPLVIPPITDYLGGLLRLVTPELKVDGAVSLERIPV